MTLAPNDCSACIEMLYANETDTFTDRIVLAAQDGFAAIEFWGTLNKDIDAIEQAAKAANIKIQGFLCDPTLALGDPSTHAEFLENVARSVALGDRLGAIGIIVIVGKIVSDLSPADQLANITSALKQACDVVGNSSVKLVLEPINQQEQPQGYLHDTAHALDIIDAVGDARLGLLYDMYHSGKQSENMVEILAGRVDRVVHVHLADTPDRHEPGTGDMAWQDNVAWLKSNGYQGLIGLEYLAENGTSEGLSFLNR